MPYISKSSIQELIDRMDASAVVSDYVHLEKRGGRLWACCPFHQEKTASFTVNPDIKSYYCFGCHKGGTLINFVEEMNKISFPEAVELLAKKFAGELVYEKSFGGNFSAPDEEEKKKKDELFDLYNRISGTFHHFLLKKPEAHPAKLYIISRGINNEMIEHFGLGYAPMDRYWLHTFLSGKAYSPEFLAGSGLFSSKDSRASIFAGRLMFPINDQQGRTVAFGGRFLEAISGEPNRGGWEPPKYINSPELRIYRKRETLYALDRAIPEIRRTKTVYIAEGYLDAIALHQAGISNAIAPLGTAFTDEQAKLLARWAEKLIFFFDSDEAGQAAVLKGIYTCRKNGIACGVVAPNVSDSQNLIKNPLVSADPKDPADILRYLGVAALQEKAQRVVGDFDYMITRARSLFANSGEKARMVSFLFPYIELLDSEVARTSCIEKAADTFGLLPSAVSDDFLRYTLNLRPTEREPGLKRDESASLPIQMNDEISLLAAAAMDYISTKREKLLSKIRSALEINTVEDSNAKEIFIALEECIRNGETGMDDLLARIPSAELRSFLLERSVSGEFSVNMEQFVEDGIKKLRKKSLKCRQDEIILKLRSIKKNNSEEQNTEVKKLEVQELLTEKMQIDDELQQLKQG